MYWVIFILAISILIFFPKDKNPTKYLGKANYAVLAFILFKVGYKISKYEILVYGIYITLLIDFYWVKFKEKSTNS